VRELLECLLQGQDLTVEQAEALLDGLVDESVEPVVKAAALAALRTKGETAGELEGMARAMRRAARPLTVPSGPGPLIDTCGTGGDGAHTINISTAAALVLAACGLRVVKHGNRSVSSKSGSADVLEALGVGLPEGPDAALKMLGETGFTFLFAPHFHSAMKAVVPIRRAMKVRTAFNMLGPLTNPAAPPYQVVGAFSPEACEKMAGALAGLGVVSACVVHGTPGWDEASPCGPFQQWLVRRGQVVHQVVDPADRYGIERCDPSDLRGGSASYNAAALLQVFEGNVGAHRDAIVLNAAIGLEMAGLASGRDAVARVSEAIDNGAVLALLSKLRG